MENLIISSSINDKKIIEVELSKINSEINVNPRSSLNMDNVDKLIEAEGQFPEIHLGLFEDKLIIVDGYHRFGAENARGSKTIKAFITKYNTMEDLETDAFNENVNHGERLNEYDIAMWIYNMYIKAIAVIPTTSLASFITKCKIDSRRARSLFNWIVFHKEILEDDIVNISKTGDIDEMYSLMIHLNEMPGSITEESKLKLKQFYNKYIGLPRQELREAIKLFKEDKDYNEIKEAEAEAKKLQDKADEEFMETLEEKDKKEYFDQFEKIDKEDSIDRNGNVSYENNVENINSNETMETIAKNNEELNEKIKETIKEIVPVDNIIDKITEQVMSLNILINNGNSTINYNNYKSIEAISLIIEQIMFNLIPEELEGYEENI